MVGMQDVTYAGNKTGAVSDKRRGVKCEIKVIVVFLQMPFD
jgi:hypothetical protein